MGILCHSPFVERAEILYRFLYRQRSLLPRVFMLYYVPHSYSNGTEDVHLAHLRRMKIWVSVGQMVNLVRKEFCRTFLGEFAMRRWLAHNE